MPLSNVGNSVDWGYLPIGYFGVDKRFGKRSDFQELVDICHQHGIAVIVDVATDTLASISPITMTTAAAVPRESILWGLFKRFVQQFGKSTDFNREITRDYSYTASHHWLEVYTSMAFATTACRITGTATGVGYANLSTKHISSQRRRLQQVSRIGAASMQGRANLSGLVQMAEQLEGPEEVLRINYSISTWRNGTFDAGARWLGRPRPAR